MFIAENFWSKRFAAPIASFSSVLANVVMCIAIGQNFIDKPNAKTNQKL